MFLTELYPRVNIFKMKMKKMKAEIICVCLFSNIIYARLHSKIMKGKETFAGQIDLIDLID